MNGIELGACIVNKTLTEVMEPKFDSRKARIMLLAIGYQESKFKERVQRGGGPAHSFWQEEPNGVTAVFNHGTSHPYLVEICKKLNVAPNAHDIYEAVATNDELGCAVARLLLYTDARALPDEGDTENAWNYYIRNWRPGKPRRNDWDESYAKAMEQVDA